MKDIIKGYYRTFKHNILYKDKFYKRVMIGLFIFLIINLIFLYMLA